MCVCVYVCLINCLHRRNHLTATSRRVKFTSRKKGKKENPVLCMLNRITYLYLFIIKMLKNDNF